MTCPVCQTEGPTREHVRHEGGAYFVDVTYTACGHTVVDTEGGI